MLGLLLMSVVLATQSLPIATALASVLEESATDLSASATAKSTSGHLTENYLPDSADYSVDNAAYDIGREDGGVSWSSPLNDASTIYENMEEAWQEEANTKFSDYVSESSDCNVQNDFDLEIYPDTDHDELFDDNITEANFSIESAESEQVVSIRCGDSRDIVYREEDYNKNLSSPNRYAELANFTAEFYTEAEEQYEAYNPSIYSGSDSECPGSGSYSQAEQEAFSSLKSDTPDFSDINSQTQKPPNTSVSGDIKENYRSNSERESTSCTVCTGSGEDRSCSSRSGSRVTVELTPTSSEIDTTIRTHEEIPIKGAYRNLVIEADEYSYSH